MIILKSIGAFFVRVWRWIKETAWVQPLLIVGAIFAVIFSIPYITEWAASWNQSGKGAFYSSYQLSLEGEDTADVKASKADAITAAIEKANEVAYAGTDNAAKSKEELKAIQDTNYADIIKDYGEKFYLVYMADDNSAASEFEEGFKFLSDNWNNESLGLKANDISDLKFRLHVINSSEESSNDGEFTKNPAQTTAWKRYLINYTGLFNVAGPWLYEHMPMVINGSMSEDKFTSFSVSSADNEFPVPTVCLCDFTLEAIADGRAGLSEVTFASTGSTANEKAKNLLNMWNHLDPYSSNNSYTSTSKKEYRVAR
ncbi:MAG: hypothetical protein K6G74_01210 [Bacilli bacterium]|nr:hypothetical protein [Bacilli bacterium]